MNTCDTCKHWKDGTYHRRVGAKTCNRIWGFDGHHTSKRTAGPDGYYTDRRYQYDEILDGNMAVLFDSCDTLSTGPKFGCVLWEKKP